MLGNTGNVHAEGRQGLAVKTGKARAVAVIAAVIGLATAALAWEETKPPAPAPPLGLAGILPDEVPQNLSADAFSVLGGNWAEWSAGAANAVTELYQSSSGDLAAQRQAIAKAKSKLTVMDKALKDRKYAKIAVPLSGLHSALSRRIDVAEAILATLEQDASKSYSQRLKSKVDGVVSATDNLKRSLKSIKGGDAWMPFVKGEELVAALKYESSGENAVAAAKASKAKLASRETIENAQQKAFLSRPSFKLLESAIDQYLGVAENPPTPETAAKLRAHLTSLVAGLEAYEANGQLAGAQQARQAFSAIRHAAPDGGTQIASALQKHYFNYNLRIMASEEFVNRLLSDSQVEQGQVSDFILGASVGGYQTTSTNVTVDLKPSQVDARWDIILTGNVNSNTQGVTQDATVYTAGNHSFRAVKEIRYNGYNFSTSSGSISVNASNQTTGIATRFSGFPLLGGIADRIAMREVEARRGEAESIAASRVQDRVMPRFNSEVDSAFAKAGSDLERDLFSHLRNTKLYPDAMLFQTTDRELKTSTRLMDTQEIGANSPPLTFATSSGATMMVHETLMNNGADRIGLAGKTMTDDEFRAHLEKFFSEALNQKFKLEPPKQPTPAEGDEDGAKPPSTFLFAPADPIRIRLQDGVLSLTLRTGFRKDDGEEIPQQVITVPLSFEVRGNKIHILRGTVKVAAADGAGQVATAAVIRRKIQNTIPERVVDGKFRMKGTRRSVDASVTSIKIVDGWAVVNVR